MFMELWGFRKMLTPSINSSSPLNHKALPNKWFEEMGLYNLENCAVGTLFHHRE